MRETISVVICTHSEERWADLGAAVGSVQRQSRAAHEIVVVADHNPGLLARVKETFADDVVAVESQGGPGLSGARNTGIATTTGDVIAFLDDDATAAPDWLERLAESYANPAVLGVGGAIVPSWPGGRPPAWFPEEFNWVVGCTYRGMPKRLIEVRNLIGANMSFRRGPLTSIDGFRQELGRVGFQPFGCEETELCIRLHECCPGRPIIYSPAVQVAHRVSPERASWSYFLARCVGEGRSKALLSELVGAERALESERSYTRRTLPRGVLRGVGDVLTHRDAGGLLRASAIVLGLTATIAGYAAGRLAALRSPVRLPVDEAAH